MNEILDVLQCRAEVQDYVHAATPHRIPLPVRRTGIGFDIFLTVVFAGGAPWWTPLFPFIPNDEMTVRYLMAWILLFGLAVTAVL